MYVSPIAIRMISKRIVGSIKIKALNPVICDPAKLAAIIKNPRNIAIGRSVE